MEQCEKVLITGGRGFIGTNFVDGLNQDGGIRVVDNLQRSSPSICPGKDVEFYKEDILNYDALTPLFDGVSSVVHLAAYGSVVESVAAPTTNFTVNVQGTLNVLRAAVETGVRRLIFASTGGALIGNVSPPVNERSLPKPISPYGASKLCGEAYCHAFARSYGLETFCLRFGNVYGPHSAHKKGAVTTFIKALMNDKPIVIYGDGFASRDYIYVDDLCLGIKLALEAEMTGGGVFHLASGRETTVLELADILRKLAGKSNHPIVFKPARRGEVIRNFATYDKARETFGFMPRCELEEGLARTWEWFESQDEGVLSYEVTDS